jgi:hypothetical protein
MKESVQSWRSKWFYLRDRPSSGNRSDLPKFTDVLEATPKKSWQNTLTTEEKLLADDLYEKILDMKNTGGRIMIGTKIVVVLLKRRIQPVMSRAHQMWLYTGVKDMTRINAAELSKNEFLDEVRRLTYVSQEDSIPLAALQDPYEFHHLPAEVILLSWHSILDMICVPDNFLFYSEFSFALSALHCRKVLCQKEKTAEVEGPTLPEWALVAPPPPKMQRKRKGAPSITASPSSTLEGHVSAVAFFFLLTMVLTRVAPDPTFGCSPPSVGLMVVQVSNCCLVLFHSLSKPWWLW